MPQLVKLEVLREPGPRRSLVYIATDIGWPFSPRDGITLFTLDEGPPLQLHMRSRPEAVPPVDGYTRIPFSEGSWTLHEANGNRTRIVYSQRVVPGGHVPQWLSDAAGVGQAEALLEALADHVTDPNRAQCEKTSGMSNAHA